MSIISRVPAILLGMAGVCALGWQAWHYAQGLPAEPIAEVASPPPATPLPASVLAVAHWYGLGAQKDPVLSRQPLTLHGVIIASDGDTRVLLQTPQGSARYRTGDPLPGGSVLRRVEPQGVVLWHNGQEEWLPFERTAALHLPASQSEGPVLANAKPIYLQLEAAKASTP